MSASFRLRAAFAAAALLALDACTVRNVSVPHHADIQQLPPVHERAFSPSFDCGEAASAVQDMVCGSTTLSALDKELAETFRRQLRDADLIGRDQLLATERHWLVTRRRACNIPPARQQDLSPDPALEACLARLYRDRIAAVAAWSAPSHADAISPVAAYVAIKGAEYRDDALCTPLSQIFETAIQRSGAIDPAHLPELVELAGTHGPAAAAQPFRLAVAGYEGGADQSYQLRARALYVGEGQQPALDQTAFTKWIKAQPNAGGRFSLTASDTKDFASIDIIRYGNRLLALAVEPWGYYSPAAIGESSYAGIFEILGPGQVEPRCLYKSYLRPPVQAGFDSLPNYRELKALLQSLQGQSPEELDPNDRRAAHLFADEIDWTLLNLPLIGTAEVRQGNWAGWLHHRQDAIWDALFAWSERDLASKRLFRKLVALARPAADELAQAYRQTQELHPGEAQQAAELLLLELFEHSVGSYPGSAAIESGKPAAFVTYRQRFATAPAESDLAAGRAVRSLHSAVLDRLPDEAIAAYLRYEFQTPGHTHSTGAGGDTTLMAAIDQPELVARLLQAGADPNETNAWRKTPLMAAAAFDQPEAAKLLLDAGAGIDAGTVAWSADENGVPMFRIYTGGRTALMYAAAGAHPALIRLLLDHGAKPQMRDSAGRTACDYLKENPALSDAEMRDSSALLCR